MSAPTFGQAAVIGTGMMGPGIALTLTLGGVPSTILSRSESGAEKGLHVAMHQLELLVENDLVTRQQAAFSRAQLSASAEFDKVVAKADLIVESAPEEMASNKT